MSCVSRAFEEDKGLFSNANFNTLLYQGGSCKRHPLRRCKEELIELKNTNKFPFRSGCKLDYCEYIGRYKWVLLVSGSPLQTRRRWISKGLQIIIVKQFPFSKVQLGDYCNHILAPSIRASQKTAPAIKNIISAHSCCNLVNLLWAFVIPY